MLVLVQPAIQYQHEPFILMQATSMSAVNNTCTHSTFSADVIIARNACTGYVLRAVAMSAA
jgi:hypothetical protein